METKHTPMKQNGTTVRFFGGGFDVRNCPEPEALAALIVRAANSHYQWAKWIVQRGPGLPDHACAECLPHSDMVKPGFQCVYHEALAAAGAA